MLSRLNGLAIGLVITLSLIKAIKAQTTWDFKSYPSVLYVWSGQDASAKSASDFVAVVDFNEKSLTYGSIIRVIRLASNPSERIGQTNNEPHHSKISSNGKYFVTGGLLSFLAKQKEIFVWNVPDNKEDGPNFKCAIDAPGACTDEFHAIGGSKFLVSMMCSESGGSPGDIVIIDADTCTAKSFLNNASSLKDFNPHGFSQLNNGSLLVGDFVSPKTIASSSTSEIVFRNTIRHFLPDGNLAQTYEADYPSQPGMTTGLGHGIGFMELKAIPNDKFSRGYACGTNTNFLYLLGPGMPKPLPVYDVSEVNNFVRRYSAGILSIFADGKRMLMSFQMRFLILVDITQPERPKFLRTFDFCTDKIISKLPIRVPGSDTSTNFKEFCVRNGNNTGTHVIIHPYGESRFIVFNYFLKFGLAQFPGTRSVHAFKLNKQLTDFTYDYRFNPNYEFNRMSYDRRQTFHSLQAYPHHAQYLKL